MNALPTAEAKLAVATGHANKPASKAGVTRAKKLLQLATKSDFNACYVEMSTDVAL
jgi:hypothetical protein